MSQTERFHGFVVRDISGSDPNVSGAYLVDSDFSAALSQFVEGRSTQRRAKMMRVALCLTILLGLCSSLLLTGVR